jgi:hypothetical protein
VALATDAGKKDIKARPNEGYRMISVGWDFDLLRNALGDTVKGMRAEIE